MKLTFDIDLVTLSDGQFEALSVFLDSLRGTENDPGKKVIPSRTTTTTTTTTTTAAKPETPKKETAKVPTKPKAITHEQVRKLAMEKGKDPDNGETNMEKIVAFCKDNYDKPGPGRLETQDQFDGLYEFLLTL